MEIYNALVQVWFATSTMKLDLGIRVAWYNLVYELLYELKNDSMFTILGNYEILEKSQA